jgi:Fe-S cluster biogenesis protein NfuA/nitrite reductase/ring-hydroxylating ferredoxin subunit
VTSDAPSPALGEDEELRREGDRIEALLEEVSGMAGPQTLARVTELMQRMVRLYGAGLERMLGHARAAAASEASLEERLCADELVASLLLLHELHPRTAPERVAEALAKVRPYLGSHAGDVELLGVDAAGVARIRLLGSCQSCPSSRVTVEDTLQRAIFDAAPEVTRVEVEGLEPSTSEGAERLVQLDVRPARQRWVRLDGLDRLELAPGTHRTLDEAGARVLILRVDAELLAYRDRCARCSASLEAARLDKGVLECAACGGRYEVSRGGRAADGGAHHLEPVPLLTDAAGVRLGLPEASR